MILEKDLQEYTKWLMEVWNPNQLHIPFALDAPQAFLAYKKKQENTYIGCSDCLKPDECEINGCAKTKYSDSGYQ